ncbi:MAG: hypothetical protein IIB60_01270 [Planctomycetes bacterium]|nr:hypothetical protein [Planctomycetota bacterium]
MALVALCTFNVPTTLGVALAQEQSGEAPKSANKTTPDPRAEGAAGEKSSADEKTPPRAAAPQRYDVTQDDALQTLIDQLPEGAINALIGAEIEVEVVGDQMILQGPEEAVAVLEAIIRALDQAAPKKVLEIVTVTKRDANDIAATIEPVLQELLFEPNQRSEDRVSVKALSSSKLLVSALPKDIDFVISVILDVDEDEERDIKDFEQLIFSVKYRKATDVAEQLKEIIRDINTKRGATGEEAEVQIIGNNANNTIMVIARENQRAQIQRLLDGLDVEPTSDAGEVKLTIFPLRHSKANELADVIENLLTSSEGREAAEEFIFRLQISKALPSGEIIDLSPIDLQKPTRIIPDEGTNSLIVATVEKNVKPLQELIELLDGVPSAEDVEVKLFPLRFADAESVRDTLREMFDGGKVLPEDPDGSGANAVPEGPYGHGLVYNIGLYADTRTNTLVFTGRPEQALLVEKIVNELDRPAVALKFPLHLIRLEYSDATRIAQVITKLFDQRFEALEATNAGRAALERERLFLSVDIQSNSLLVSASEENYRELFTIARQLDTQPTQRLEHIRIIMCQRLTASDLKEKIDELWARKSALRGEAELLDDQPIIVADERSNALIVASSVEDYEEIKTLVETLEAKPLLNDTRLFELEFADAMVLSAMLEELFQGMAGQSDTFQAPTILPDPRSNALVIAATRDAMERVEVLVKRLDVEAGPMTAVFKVYSLTHASATKLAQRMQELFDSRSDADQTSRTPIVILAEESSNSLVCSASRDDHEAIRELLTLLDRPSDIAKQFHIFPLKMANATQVAEKLDTLFQSQAEGGSGRADAIAIEADERTNSLIVWASPSEMQNISEMVGRLDTSTPAVEMMVKIIQLKQALAQDFATLMTDGLFGEGGDDDERAVILAWTDTLPNGKETVRKLLRQNIRIEADPRTNSLMVVAPMDSMEMLEAMIRKFDAIRPIQSEIRLFPLVNADAGNMVEQLTEIFEPDTGEGETARVYNFGDEFGDVELARVGQELRFTADSRTNTVIVAGAEIDLRMVEELIRYLDAQEAEDRIVEVVQAKYLSAQDLASAVENFNQKEQDVLGLMDDEEAQQRRMERQISIEAVGDAEAGSSKLIVGTSRQAYQSTMAMIDKLDRPEPQVMISVLIAEVSLTDSVELGIEIAGQDLHFSENAVVGPNGIIQGNQFDYVLGTDLGAIGLGLGGLNFTVTGEDFAFLLPALQQNSRLETLSRPILMVRNGEEGNITIADQVPFVASSQINDTGSTNSVINREDVGIVLTATPTISPDGYVTIALRQELSSFSGENLQLTEGVSSPIFSTREVETNITIRDGETVIIGGLITSRESEVENKIPILGDLPWIGPLFRSTSVSTAKTELLIALTVDILRTDEDVHRMSVEQRDKFVLPDSIRQSPLMEGLRILPQDSLLGPVGGGVEAPAAAPRPEKRDLYGPQPKVYGPRIARPSTTSTATGPVYGPRIARGVTAEGA